MPDRLLVRLHADGSLAWLAQGAQGRAMSPSRSGAPPAETLARAQSVIVLVPAEAVLLLEAPALSSRRAQLLKALPFALEDQLVSAVEDLHFAIPEKTGTGRVAVAVVARLSMRSWIETLATQGIRPDAMYAETMALEVQPDSATLLIDGPRALYRSGTTRAWACATDALAEWLDLAAPASVRVYDFRTSPRIVLNVPSVDYHERQQDVLALLARNLDAQPAIDLLQGEFAPRHRHAPAQRLWWRAAALVAAGLLLGFAYAIGDYFHLKRTSQALEDSARAALHASQPQFDAVAGDPRQLMESALSRMRGGSVAGGVLQVLNAVAPVLAATTRVNVKSLEYRNATLELGLRAPDVAALDLVREQINNVHGMVAEVTAASTSDNVVDGRVRVSAAKP